MSGVELSIPSIPDRETVISLLRTWKSSLSAEAPVVDELRGFDREQVINILGSLISDDSEPVLQDIAIKVLVQLDEDRSVDLLLPLLKHPNGLMRGYICNVLLEIGDQRAIEPLVKVLREDPDSDVRFAAAVALGYIGDMRAIPALQYAVEHDNGTNYERTPVAKVAEDAIQYILARNPK